MYAGVQCAMIVIIRQTVKSNATQWLNSDRVGFITQQPQRASVHSLG